MTDQTATPRPTPIAARDILRALQYPDTFFPNEMTPMEIWAYELPGIVAWINGLLEAATQDAEQRVQAAREEGRKDYEKLRDIIIEELDPEDEDIAEEAIMAQAIRHCGPSVRFVNAFQAYTNDWEDRAISLADMHKALVEITNPVEALDAMKMAFSVDPAFGKFKLNLLTTEAKGVVVFAPDPLDGTPAVFNLTTEAS